MKNDENVNVQTENNGESISYTTNCESFINIYRDQQPDWKA